MMIEGQYSAGASTSHPTDTNSTAGSGAEKSSKSVKTFANKFITHLPNELIVKILSDPSLNLRDLSACRRVNRRWQGLVDDHHLLARPYSRHLHHQPMPQAAQHYQTFTRGWLADFSDKGWELTAQLDRLLRHPHFPEIVFFSIAKLFASTRHLTCQNVETVHHSTQVRMASFSPDGSRLVTASDGGNARIWELIDGKWLKKTTIGHRGSVNNARFSPDGRHLVTTSYAGTVKIHSLVAGQWQRKVTIRHGEIVWDARFSPDGIHLVTASEDNTTEIWRLDAGQWRPRGSVSHDDAVNFASFSPDGRHLATASADHTALIWRRDAMRWEVRAILWHSEDVGIARFSPDGSYLVTASADNTAKIWRCVGGWPLKATIRHARQVFNANFSPDGNRLATCSADRTIKIRKFVDGQWLEEPTIWHRRWRVESTRPYSFWAPNAIFSPDGCHLATYSINIRTVGIWGLVAGRWQEKVIVRHSDWVNSVSFSPDGGRLVTACADNTAQVWLLKCGEGCDRT